MANDKKKTCKDSCSSRRGAVGGQAVLEGIMMRAENRYTTAVRVADTGKIVRDSHTIQGDFASKCRKIPLVRGVASFLSSLQLSMSTITFSAEAQGIDDEPTTKFEKWLVRVFGEKLMSVVAGIGTVLGVLLAVALFVWLPSFLVGLLFPKDDFRFVNALLQGVLRIAIFIGYVAAVSLMKDMRRTFEYHGAEHKSIFCYEKGLELTVENIRKQSRFHPRCGTSFLFVMLFVGILLNVFLNFIPIPAELFGWKVGNLIYTLLKLLTLPIVMGVGFEIIRFAGRHDNRFVNLLVAPGLWMQRLTTREPDDKQIEVAIVALKSALVNEFSEEDVYAGIEDARPSAPKTGEETAEQTDGKSSGQDA